MAAGHEQRHQLEFGGSPVGSEFDGSLSFRLIDRIPVFTVSQQFTAHTARQLRYGLVSTWGPERPSYTRYQWVIIDLQMVSGFQQGAEQFLAALRDRLRELRGDLVLVRHGGPGLTADFLTAETLDDALTLVREKRAGARSEALQR